jgi:hypothetical protein
MGWKALSGRLRDKPASADKKVVQAMERITGAPLPPTLLAFWEVVGGIDFVWSYDDGDAPSLLGVDLPMEELDPLSVSSARALAYQLDEWADQHADESDRAKPFEVELAPDALHKGNISGGAPYGISLPFRGADPVFQYEPHALPFTDYLRLCFRYGGFPGLEKHEREPGVRALVAHLTDGLAPLGR